jgi:hypothetical protein
MYFSFKATLLKNYPTFLSHIRLKKVHTQQNKQVNIATGGEGTEEHRHMSMVASTSL